MSFNGSMRMTTRIAPTVVAILLGIAVLAGCQNEGKPAGAPAAASDSPYHVRATVAEIMDSMVMPAADILWKSTAVIESVEGTKDLTPTNDEEWKVVERAAVVMSEALNALMIPGRAVAPPGAPVDDDGDELQPAQIEELIERMISRSLGATSCILSSEVTGCAIFIKGWRSIKKVSAMGKAMLNEA